MAGDRPVPTTVYILRDSRGAPLYVGVTNSVPRRFRQHAASKRWWPLVDTHHLIRFPDRQSALAWEAALIEVLIPQFNLTGDAHAERKRDLHDGVAELAGCLGMPA